MITPTFPGFLFGFSMAMHYTLTNALPGCALGLVILQLLYITTNSRVYAQAGGLFTRLVSIQLAISLISGLCLESDLHQNWTGNGNALVLLINHPLGRTAFFGFLLTAMLLLLLNIFVRIKKVVALIIYLLILLGSVALSWWALVVNSWMHTPAGVNFGFTQDNIFQVSIINLHAFIFNPSYILRFWHFITAALLQGLLLTVLLLVYLHHKAEVFAKLTGGIKVLSVTVLLLLLLQPFIGHNLYGLMAKYQPAKAASFEGYYKSSDSLHFYLLAVTNPQNQTTIGLHLPKPLEQHIAESYPVIPALDQTRQQDWPRVRLAFYAFHSMLACWFALLVCIIISFSGFMVSRPKARIYLFQMAFAFSLAAPVAGWIASETGRQPWLIFGVLKTSAASSFQPVFIEITLSLLLNFLLPVCLLALGGYLIKMELNYFLISPHPVHRETDR